MATEKQTQPSSEKQTQQPSKLERKEAPKAPSLWREDAVSMGPLGLMARLMEDMGRLFGEDGLGRGRLWTPRVEVREKDGQLLVRADLPGLEPADVRVEALDDTLIIEGERQHHHEEGEARGLLRSEMAYGSFRREISLPEGIEPSDITARFENGVLEVAMRLPTPEQRQPKRIEIKGQATPTGGVH